MLPFYLEPRPACNIVAENKSCLFLSLSYVRCYVRCFLSERELESEPRAWLSDDSVDFSDATWYDLAGFNCMLSGSPYCHKIDLAS